MWLSDVGVRFNFDDTLARVAHQNNRIHCFHQLVTRWRWILHLLNYIWQFVMRWQKWSVLMKRFWTRQRQYHPMKNKYSAIHQKVMETKQINASYTLVDQIVRVRAPYAFVYKIDVTHARMTTRQINFRGLRTCYGDARDWTVSLGCMLMCWIDNGEKISRDCCCFWC